MKKALRLSLLLCSVTIIFLCSACGKSNFELPDQDQFELFIEVNKNEFLVGEELKVNSIFHNHSEKSYEMNSSATFSQTGLININLFEQEQEEMFMVGAARKVTVKGNDEIVEQQNFILEKPGNYELVVLSSFDITHPQTNENKSYLIKADTLHIEVKDQ